MILVLVKLSPQTGQNQQILIYYNNIFDHVFISLVFVQVLSVIMASHKKQTFVVQLPNKWLLWVGYFMWIKNI